MPIYNAYVGSSGVGNIVQQATFYNDFVKYFAKQKYYYKALLLLNRLNAILKCFAINFIVNWC